MDKLKRERTPLRNTITRTTNEIKSGLSLKEVDIILIRAKFERLTILNDRLILIDDKIKEILLDDPRSTEAQINDEMELCETYSLQVGIVAQKLKEYESKLAAPCDDKMSQSSTSDVKRQIKLPKFELKKYTGPKHSKMVRVLLDSGSQKSYIRRSLAKELDLPKLDNVDKGKAFKMEALEETIICGNISPVETGPRQWELDKKGITLTKVDNNKTEIDILIGGDYYGQLLTGKIEQLAGGLTAIQTVLGWTLIGNTSSERPETSAQMVITLLTTQQRVASLWELETIGIRDPTEVISVKEKNVLMQEKFREKICRGHDGRYLVSLPWKEGIGTIPNNLEIAKRRLEAMTQRLTQKGQFVPYDEVFRSWFRENLIEEVDREDIRPTGHYLPHRPIYKVQSQTTPIRPVYDASCKSSKRSLSLNECLETGPNLIELLPEILIRFREKKIGAIADIRKAFQTIGIDEKERDYLRFLWWDEQDPSKIRTLRHTRVVFGLTCSPFILAAVLKYHLESIVDDRKSVADVLKRSFYVDNLVFSVDEPDELERIREVANDIMDEAKMTLREWEYGGSKILENKEDSRVLGLYWNKERDTLRCHIPQDTTKYGEVTKRTLLSNLQKFFDPLGFYQPIFLIPKLLMQRAWLLKLGWDQPLPTDIQQEFKKWSEELDHVKKLEFPRYARVTRSENLELHVFGDASKRAYATVVFLRSVQDGIVHISLLAAKTRVAPLKSITIPRLELLACLLSARLATSIVRALARPIKTIFWSDSSTALSWISTKHEWSIFVSNRVNEIRSSTNIDDWRFVPGTLNPADLPSRGCYAPQFILSKWWEGPQWLRESEDKWPKQKPIPNEEQVLEEKKGTVVQNTIVQNRTFWYISKFSSYKANLRVLAWVLRFIKILKREEIQGKTLSMHEVVQAEKVLIRLVQRDSLGKGQISHLKTKVQSDGLMYIETKLLYDQSPEEFRKPVLLPCDHPITEQLIRETHLNNCHAGVHFLLSKLREKFWILKARKTIKRVVRGCIICRRHAEKANTIPCAPLPKDRLFMGRPFEVTGVDLMGPLYLKNGQKIWITLFTCAVYRAVHLELVEGLDATNFIMALERFIHRRGRPVKIYSDNGTNFKRTNRLFTNLNWDKIARYSCDKQIRWIFIPPSAPWWGGWWERLVRLVKDLLRRTLGTKRVNYVQLETLICHVEAIINTRPLTYISETEDDLIPITPQMFIQNNFGSFDESHELSPDNTRQHFRKLQQIKKELKERFHKEYLAMLVQKGNETEGRRFLPGEVVLIGRDDQKRIFWPLGRILELYPGKDGRERVARVRTATGEFVRPLKRLFSLELGSDISRENTTCPSLQTISRRLVANGLHSCRPLRRLPLTPPNRRQRLEWCRARSTWMTEWHRVVFSDESRFCLSSDSRRVRVWRRRGERSNPAAIVERPSVRQRGIMVWGAIAYDSRSPLLRIQGTMTAQRYVDDVLRPVTLPYLQRVPNALYQQDNARPHTARISQQALQDVQMLPWPPYSPDLSPIEHVWDIIGRRLHALPQPRSEDELWQMVEREWRAIPQDAIRTLIDSLPRRVAACIAVRGGPTCY
ncbi:hypothetical protein LAZ67_1000938 [Cordylochernes scorpioides]|uniref:Integrase catalytic domain-containing protein n=1 Tax=Cordylochernes scorpioides TaxID=51811 RepID=A0ABY6JV06_9ARAC|nr:hypothetical protein LAZ67_1000938 [Cordylochernes scorpioides]